MSNDNQQGCEGCPASRPDRREFLKAAAAVSTAMTVTQASALTALRSPRPPLPCRRSRSGNTRCSRLSWDATTSTAAGTSLLSCKGRLANTTRRNGQSRHCAAARRWASTPGSRTSEGRCWGSSTACDRQAERCRCSALTNGDEDMEEAARVEGLIGVAHHGEVTDRLFKQGNLDVVRDRLKRIRDAGLLVGVSTHMPAVVNAVESKGWDVDYYQTCVYERNRTEEELQKLLGHVPLPREVFLKDDPPRMFQAIRQTKKTCLAFKILAAGRRLDVKQAFKETSPASSPPTPYRRHLRPLRRPGGAERRAWLAGSVPGRRRGAARPHPMRPNRPGQPHRGNSVGLCGTEHGHRTLSNL